MSAERKALVKWAVVGGAGFIVGLVGAAQSGLAWDIAWIAGMLFFVVGVIKAAPLVAKEGRRKKKERRQ